MIGTPLVGLDKRSWYSDIEIQFVYNVPWFVVGILDIHFLLKHRDFIDNEGIWLGVAYRRGLLIRLLLNFEGCLPEVVDEGGFLLS